MDQLYRGAIRAAKDRVSRLYRLIGEQRRLRSALTLLILFDRLRMKTTSMSGSEGILPM